MDESQYSTTTPTNNWTLKDIFVILQSFAEEIVCQPPTRGRVFMSLGGTAGFTSLVCQNSLDIFHGIEVSKKSRKVKPSWLVVGPPLWKILVNYSQLGWLFPIYGKIKHVPNHQPEENRSVDFSWRVPPPNKGAREAPQRRQTGPCPAMPST